MSDMTGPTGIFPGMIMMFSGLIAAVPVGWQHCDGTNGTPDLREKFVRCSNTDSGAGDNPGDLGGNDAIANHTLTESEMPAHVHNYQDPDTATPQIVSFGSNGLAVQGESTQSTTSTGGGSGHNHGDNKPAFHSLVYIMKL